MVPPQESLALLRQDLVAQARSISALVEDQRDTKKLVYEIQTDRRVKEEREKNLRQDLAHLRGDLDELKTELRRLYNVGWYLLMALGTVFLTAIGKWVISGGLNVAPPI